jgi:GTP diphosphokinase / guanosine-3',5'-bis(diphosphate) 3'-diphosphatase
MSNAVVQISRALDYAAKKHVGQRRKGVAQEPYINHLAEVAYLLAEATGGSDTNLIIAGLLHDCIEDQGVTHAELVELFGDDVADLVRDVTDDKTLLKAERKRLQVEHTPHKSDRVKMLKIADKTSNLHALAVSPPSGWDAQRIRDYYAWARAVVAGCRGVNAFLEAKFDAAWRSGQS